MMIAEISLPEISLSRLLTFVGLGTAIALAISILVVSVSKQHQTGDRHHRWYSVAVYFVFLATVAVLALSSFGALIRYGHLEGYPLMTHIAAAGAFVFLLLLVAFLYLPTGAANDQPGFTAGDRWWLSRWSAWGLIGSSLIAAGTMLLSMLPLFGTESLLLVAAVHRYAGLVVVVTAIFHFYSLICIRLGYR